MPLTFGAVGDVTAVALLVKDILSALDSSRGAAPQYQALKSELYVLERILLEVEHLFRDCESTPELADTCTSASRCITDCRATVDGFLKKIEKYAKTLEKRPVAGAVSQTIGKICWTLLNKDDVVTFRGDISTHSAHLNMIISSANLKLLQLYSRQTSDTSSITSDLLTFHGNTLHDMQYQLHERDSMMSTQEEKLAYIQETLEEHTVLLYRHGADLAHIYRLVRFDRILTPHLLDFKLQLANQARAFKVLLTEQDLYLGRACLVSLQIGTIRIGIMTTKAQLNDTLAFFFSAVHSLVFAYKSELGSFVFLGPFPCWSMCITSERFFKQRFVPLAEANVCDIVLPKVLVDIVTFGAYCAFCIHVIIQHLAGHNTSSELGTQSLDVFVFITGALCFDILLLSTSDLACKSTEEVHELGRK